MRFGNIKNLHKKISVARQDETYTVLEIVGKQTLMAVFDSWVLNHYEIMVNKHLDVDNKFRLVMKTKDFKSKWGNFESIEDYFKRITS